MITCDVAVIGAGYIGCSVAYNLAKAGLSTILIDQGGVASGASGANYGNIQIQDAELKASLPFMQAARGSWEEIEFELESSLGRRGLGSLLLIETPKQWQIMAERLPRLRAHGIAAELVRAEDIAEIEPLLDATKLLGACYYEHESQINPFSLLWAFVRRGRQLGLSLHLRSQVRDIRVQAGIVRTIQTSGGPINCGWLVLCTGAWTSALGRALGYRWDIPFITGQALVTEAYAPLRLRNHIASAAFFEEAHAPVHEPGVQAALAISQSTSGHFLLGEAITHGSTQDRFATAQGLAAIARLGSRYVPQLTSLRALRGWASPVAFTRDGLPFLGQVAGVDNLILATAFKSTVIATPITGRLVCQIILGAETEIDLAPFSPNRAVMVS